MKKRLLLRSRVDGSSSGSAFEESRGSSRAERNKEEHTITSHNNLCVSPLKNSFDGAYGIISLETEEKKKSRELID